MAIEIYCTDRIVAVRPQVLLGIEISCADRLHVIGVFNPVDIPPARKNIEGKINTWLKDHVMSQKDGTYLVSKDVLSWINASMNGIGYIAHLDTADLFSKDYLSDAYRKKLFSDKNNMIGLSDISKVQEMNKRIARYSKLVPVYFWDCDSHAIDDFCGKSFWIKGQKCDFNMLQNAIRDYDIAVHIGEDKPVEPKQSILGMAIDSGDSGFLTAKDGRPESIITFSDSLNCFIGGRGTGKSTVLNLINFVLGQYLPADVNSAKGILEMICRYGRIIVFCRCEEHDYTVSFLPPTKEYPDDDILKAFELPSHSPKKRYHFNADNVAEYAIRNYIQIFKITHTNARRGKEEINGMTEKKKILRKLYNIGYSVNDLVQKASSSEISSYISTILLKNEVLSKPPSTTARAKSGLNAWLTNIEKNLTARNTTVQNSINAYNTAQKKKLRIVYIQDKNCPLENTFDKFFSSEPEQYYKGKNIKTKSLHDYLLNVSAKMGPIVFLKALIGGDFVSINETLNLLDYCEDLTEKMIGEGVVELKKDTLDLFFKSLADEVLSDRNIRQWIEILNIWLSRMERFDLEFNLHNNEPKRNAASMFRSVSQLSLGQKVVALLSFVMSYSDYSEDYTPLIIDQPEDNLDSQYIYKNLVDDLRKIKGKRQALIATHNSTIVTNAKAEQVIVMGSDNNHGWVEKSGYPTEIPIIRSIVNILEGGVDSFKHKSFIYNPVISK